MEVGRQPLAEHSESLVDRERRAEGPGAERKLWLYYGFPTGASGAPALDCRGKDPKETYGFSPWENEPYHTYDTHAPPQTQTISKFPERLFEALK